MIDGARRWKGRIKEVRRGQDGDVVVLETDAGTQEFPFAAIDKARLVPKIEWRKTK
jgi:ribosome maturation factor RimP